MIALLRGTLVEKHPNQAIVDASGVGYDVTISVSTFTALPDPGARVELRIHTHVREDAISLFGFLSAQEKQLFEKLITVSGIGPKLAITALSGLAAGSLIAAIRNGAVDQLVRIPGVGKKTAERIVLELRDKMDALGPASTPAGLPLAPLDPTDNDVISALVNLGLQRPAAETALKKAKAATTATGFEALFRKALEFSR
ncbi:MAG: Holliday junction branch migration protein RuvA [Bryobacterales bacterium]|nr:Holliday junction branch migration protein RuvA [Bryobacterales bacterium]